MSIVKSIDIFRDYDNITKYHIYCNGTYESMPITYMTILKYIVYHRFKNDSMIEYYAKVPGSLESHYLHPIYYINNVMHISEAKINYGDIKEIKSYSNVKDLAILYFNTETKEHKGHNELDIICNVTTSNPFDTVIHLDTIEDGDKIPLANIKLTMTTNGIILDGEMIEQEEIDLQ